MLVTDYQTYWTFVRSYHMGDKSILVFLNLLAMGKTKEAVLARQFCLKHEAQPGDENASS